MRLIEIMQLMWPFKHTQIYFCNLKNDAYMEFPEDTHFLNSLALFCNRHRHRARWIFLINYQTFNKLPNFHHYNKLMGRFAHITISYDNFLRKVKKLGNKTIFREAIHRRERYLQEIYINAWIYSETCSVEQHRC